MTSIHSYFLSRQFDGVNVFSVSGVFVSCGIMLSCVCRINSTRPRHWRISMNQMLYVMFAAWAMETLTTLLLLETFTGYDMAFGIIIMLHLGSTYKDWAGHDCVCDMLNYWREEHRARIKAVREGRQFSRRKTDLRT